MLKRPLFAAALALGLVTAVLFAARRPLGLWAYRRAAERRLRQDLLAELPDGLHVGLGGSGAPLADPRRAGPCVFVIAGKHLLIVDAGEGSPRQLALMGVPLGRVDAVLLTHFHSDHIAALGELMLQRWGAGSHADPLPVYGPQGVATVVAGFNQAYSLDDGYRVAHHGPVSFPPQGAGGVARAFTVQRGSTQPQVLLQWDGLTVTAFAVDHGPVFPAVGYRFDYAGRSVVVSGDTAPCESLERAAAGADVLFNEGLQTALVSVLEAAAEAAGRPGAAKILHDIPGYHSRPEDAAALAQRAGVGRLVFYHIIPPLPTPLLDAAFLGDAPRLFHGPITVGQDGLLLSLPSGSERVERRRLL